MKPVSKITAGYFGKLPQYNDFIKYNAGGPEILKLDEWVQQGIRTAKIKMKNNWKALYNRAPVYKFIYPFTNTPNLISGAIEPGYDRSRREYPFIVFATLPFTELDINDYYLLPLILSKPLNEVSRIARHFYHSINDELTSITMYASVPEYQEKFNEYLRLTQKKFWDSTIIDASFIEIFKNNLLHLHLNGSCCVKLSVNSSKEDFAYNLSVFMVLVVNAVNNSQMPAVFWSSDDVLHKIIFSFQPGVLQYSDLLDAENAQLINLNSFPKETSEQDLHNKVFNDDSTVNDLITQIKNLKE